MTHENPQQNSLRSKQQGDPASLLETLQGQLAGKEPQPAEFSWTLRELAESVDGEILHHQGEDEVRFNRVSTDTRTLEPGSLYVAIQGERFDGHAFAEEAVRQGASALLVSQPVASAVPVVLVDDTRIALGRFAHWHRRQMPVKRLVAVTGSNGKTTVKAMLQALFSRAGRTLATEGNLNNDYGVPRTLLNLRPHHEYAVIEMGANHEGEIAYLTRLAEPDIALLNNASGAHLEGFGSLQGVIRAKGEIFEGLNRFHSHGTAIINTDSPGFEQWVKKLEELNVEAVRTFGTDEMAEFRLAGLETKKESLHFTLLVEDESHPLKLPMLGAHNALNAAASAAVARSAGLDWETITTAMARFEGVPGRLQRQRIVSGWLIDDSYNANPESVKAAIRTLAALPGKTALCLGGMAELGSGAREAHEAVAEFAREQGIDRLYVLGEATRSMPDSFGDGAFWFAEAADLAEQVAQAVQAADVEHILVKGSRRAGMEKVAQALLQQLQTQNGI